MWVSDFSLFGVFRITHLASLRVPVWICEADAISAFKISLKTFLS